MNYFDLRDLLIPETQSQSSLNSNSPNFIYIKDKNQILNQPTETLLKKPTDYSISKGLKTVVDKNLNYKNGYYLVLNNDNIVSFSPLTQLSDIYPESAHGIVPSIKLDAKKFIQQLNSKDSSSDNGLFAIIEPHEKAMYLGEYPQNYASNDIRENLIKSPTAINKNNAISSSFDNDGNNNFDYIYNFEGCEYVRVDQKRLFSKTLFFNKELIRWDIDNWDDLPKKLNRYGNGSAKYIELTANKILTCGIQPEKAMDYLNGRKEYNMSGFLHDAFGLTYKELINHENTSLQTNNRKGEEKTMNLNAQQTNLSNIKKNKSGYNVTVDEAPMSIDEQLKFYIENRKSFMLHGPSGVGKSDRISQLDKNFESIVLRNGILPEEVIGKTIYPNGKSFDPEWYKSIINDLNNNDNLDEVLKKVENQSISTEGIWIPPVWYTNLVKKCENEPNKTHVLFVDEITNVRPNEQSLVFHLILNKSIGPNIGILPENSVVVAAGNTKEESEAAYNMPEPLFRRFNGHIYLKPNIKDWLEWGSRKNDENPNRTNIHPLVSAFVGTFGNKVFYTKYDADKGTKYAIDPRGLEQISDIIYNNNGIIRKELIENKVGKDITTAFIKFAKEPPLSALDILEKNYSKDDIPEKFDEQYALMLSLRNVGNESVFEIRDFIKNNLNKELLSNFDELWIGDNSERAILLSSDNIITTEKSDFIIEEKSDEADILNRAYKTSIDEFWKRTEDLSKPYYGVNLTTFDELKVFLDASKGNKNAKYINDSYEYLLENNHGKNTIIANDNTVRFKPNFPNERILEFKDIDFRDKLSDINQTQLISAFNSTTPFEDKPEEFPECELNLKEN